MWPRWESIGNLSGAIGGPCEATFEERGKDRWRAKVYLGAGPNGTNRYLTRTIRGPKRHAENVLAQLIVEAGTGGHDVTDGTLEQLARRWIEATGPGMSPTTLRGYEQLLRTAILPRIGYMKLRALRPQTLDQLYGELLQHGGKDGKPLGPRSVHAVADVAHSRAAAASTPSTNATLARRLRRCAANCVQAASCDRGVGPTAVVALRRSLC